MKRLSGSSVTGKLLLKRVPEFRLLELAAAGFSGLIGRSCKNLPSVIKSARKKPTFFPERIKRTEFENKLPGIKKIGISLDFMEDHSERQILDLQIFPVKEGQNLNEWTDSLKGILGLSEKAIARIRTQPPKTPFPIGKTLSVERATELMMALKQVGVSARIIKSFANAKGLVVINTLGERDFLKLAAIPICQKLDISFRSAFTILSKASSGDIPIYPKITIPKSEKVKEALAPLGLQTEFYFLRPGEAGILRLEPIKTVKDARNLKAWLEHRFGITDQKAKEILLTVRDGGMVLAESIFESYAYQEIKSLEEYKVPFSFETIPDKESLPPLSPPIPEQPEERTEPSSAVDTVPTETAEPQAPEVDEPEVAVFDFQGDIMVEEEKEKEKEKEKSETEEGDDLDEAAIAAGAAGAAAAAFSAAEAPEAEEAEQEAEEPQAVEEETEQEDLAGNDGGGAFSTGNEDHETDGRVALEHGEGTEQKTEGYPEPERQGEREDEEELVEGSLQSREEEDEFLETVPDTVGQLTTAWETDEAPPEFSPSPLLETDEEEIPGTEPPSPLEADLERLEEEEFPGIATVEEGEPEPDTAPRPKWSKWKKRLPQQFLKWESHLKWVYGFAIIFLAYVLYSFDKLMDDWQKIGIYWGAFLLLSVAYRMKIFKRLPWRLIFTVGAAFLSIKYMYWRTFETLSYTGFFDFLGMSALYLAELHGMTIHLFSMVINIWPFEREKLELDEEDLTDPDLPTVDIFIPTYTESLEIVKITATACKHLRYPKDKLNIFILDDGATVAKRTSPKGSNEAWERFYKLRELADQLGVNYLTRESNFRAKAGNINHALMQSDGDLILVLDCDHVPTKDILAKTVPYFLQDDDLYLAQTPHFFINPTPVEKTLEGVSNVSVENDMFFRVIHAGLDFWNSSYFCGSAAVLRRKHVMEIEGFLGETITEDAETSLSLHAKGYNSVFVNHPMVCGLSPETFDDYITQRTRWAQGMMQILLLNNALTVKGLNLPQRLCYFNSSFFWLFSISRFIYFIAPSLFLLFGLMVYNASMAQIFIYALPYVASTTIVMDFFFGKARQPFFSEIYESVQSLFLLPAIISVLLHPTKPKFKVTPKGAQVEREYLNPLASAFILVIFINILALYLGVLKWFAQPLYRDVIAITGGWCTYNLFIAITSLGAFWERKQIRKHHRINTTGKVKVTLLPEKNEIFYCEIKDISLAGLSFLGDLPDKVKRLDRVRLDVTDENNDHWQFDGTLQRVAPMSGRVFGGVEFDNINENFEKHVQYVYGNSYRWMDIWERKSSYEGTPRLLGFLFLRGLSAFKEIMISYVEQFIDTIKTKWKANKEKEKPAQAES